jgi:hypothetical protein
MVIREGDRPGLEAASASFVALLKGQIYQHLLWDEFLLFRLMHCQLKIGVPGT